MIINFDDFNSITSVFYHQAEDLNDQPYLWKKSGNKYVSLNWIQVREQVKSLATYFQDIGILEGDRVLILSENRPEWQITDLAIMSIGAISVPAYTTSTSNDYRYIIEHSGARCAVVSSHELMKKVLPAIEQVSHCQNVIKINQDNERYTEVVNVVSFNKILEENLAKNRDTKVFEDLSKTFKRTDTACIIYTSGTGGNPKGVMLSHGAMLRNCASCDKLLESLTKDLKEMRYLSWLPLSHSYEHTLQFLEMGQGAQIYYAESIDKLLVNMAEAAPHFMTAVPRFYDSLHTRISQGLKNQSKLSQRFFEITLRLGIKKYYGEDMNFLDKFLNGLMDKIVRKKVKKRFGGSLRALISGGAALNFEVGLYLTALGLPLLQGYGQTETAPVISANPPEKIKLDTVGKVLMGNEVKISNDGEILARGELVMNGYWNDPEATNKTIIDGWVHTGDIGEFDDENYLKITDRKKDIIVNAGGDNISPSRIEAKLDIEPEIAQSMLYGDFKNYLVAIIVPNKELALEWARDNNVEANLTSIIKDSSYIQKIREVIDKVNKNLSGIEQIRKFILIDHEFTIENNMMTPSMKVRRFKVKDKYKEDLENLY